MIVFFYGATTLSLGGVGVVLYISHTHFYSLKIGCGSSTNTRAELLALWGFIHITCAMGLSQLKVFGDSKIIINWINEVVNLQVLEMDYWCARTKDQG